MSYCVITCLKSFEICNVSWFMQDGAPANTAQSITQWLEDCGVDYLVKSGLVIHQI